TAYLSTYPFLSEHQQKVLKLHEKSLWHLSSWCILQVTHHQFPVCIWDQSEEHRNEQCMVIAPSIIPFSPGDMSYKRYKCCRLPGWCSEHRHPSEKEAYPDHLSQRVKGSCCPWAFIFFFSYCFSDSKAEKS
uniref:NADH dehydrogenase [ubiquinone] 1 beta subcomplex subunit 9 n=1 Tax=Calidris pygmaea TaxID=425635 RepID=A0A8C3K5Z3_9CHAR